MSIEEECASSSLHPMNSTNQWQILSLDQYKHVALRYEKSIVKMQQW